MYGQNENNKKDNKILHKAVLKLKKAVTEKLKNSIEKFS